MIAAQDNDELRELYRELILDHARSPRHFGKLDGATHSAEGINPLCGDKLHLYLVIDDNATITDIGFEGSGCAISLASASLLTEAVVGQSVDDAIAWFRTVTARLTGPAANQDNGLELGRIRALDGVREYPSRVKCATLAWHALNTAVRQNGAAATTE